MQVFTWMHIMYWVFCHLRASKGRRALCFNSSVSSAPSWADWGGEAADPALGGVYGLLWPQHTHHWESFVRTRGCFLWLQRPRPWGQGRVTHYDHYDVLQQLYIFVKETRDKATVLMIKLMHSHYILLKEPQLSLLPEMRWFHRSWSRCTFMRIVCVRVLQWDAGRSKAVSDQTVHGWALVQTQGGDLPGLVSTGNWKTHAAFTGGKQTTATSVHCDPLHTKLHLTACLSVVLLNFLLWNYRCYKNLHISSTLHFC